MTVPNFQYRPANIRFRSSEIEQYLRDHPENKEVHENVLQALAQGIGGYRLITDPAYSAVLEACDKTMVVKMIKSFPYTKQQQMALGLTKTDEALPNLRKFLADVEPSSKEL